VSDSVGEPDDVVEQHLQRYGLHPAGENLEEVRALLVEETNRERGEQGCGNTELMRLCCVQLLNAGLLLDVALIWRAKTASFDCECGLDIQLLCGAGLAETKDFLAAQGQVPEAEAALERILACEEAGDFEGFAVDAWAAGYARYFGQE
jgi:hypothetical protein